MTRPPKAEWKPLKIQYMMLMSTVQLKVFQITLV